MEATIRGRNVGITEKFEEYVLSKTDKVVGLAPKTIAFEVQVSRRSDRSPQNGDRVELTLIGPGPVVRAESDGPDKFAAFDIAYGRLLERIRRANDRKKDRRGRGRTSIGEATGGDFGGIDVTPASPEVLEGVANGNVPAPAAEEPDYSPVVIRSKEFPPSRLSVEEAVDQMELVGHDFFLFVETSSGKPSVVYRRKGWDYGVISLQDEAPVAAASAAR
ncbi:ribosome hibernation-promoting factor, HPF/YfiA family [Leucobacter sp. M11]|uniref:ribosome hibernation-promoting factor, HPF/YfiA family n=1 Tax=Leucobacter sp. M11 TaxID=2993565 RepID=UPI002D7E4FC8|nr:ribosome-associated translation inhibitor RaiA [Leucobacter sp. M11]MEB4615454.1 ribosome-associated translation inhibitor RaiA [Leucobacter sp. M11]